MSHVQVLHALYTAHAIAAPNRFNGANQELSKPAERESTEDYWGARNAGGGGVQ